LGTKLNKLPNHFKNLENLEPFKKQLKTFFIATDFLFDRRILVLCVDTLKGNFVEKYSIGNQTCRNLVETCSKNYPFATGIWYLNFSTPVCKMQIIQEPKKVAL
jgi:hypothetical protein